MAGRRGNKGGPSPGKFGGDGALVGRIHAILRDGIGNDPDMLTNVDDVFDALLARHREYQRKPKNPFRKAVARVLVEARKKKDAQQQQQQQQKQQQSGDVDGAGGKGGKGGKGGAGAAKRGRADDGDSVGTDSDIDEEAIAGAGGPGSAAIGSGPVLVEATDYNLLNASLYAPRRPAKLLSGTSSADVAAASAAAAAAAAAPAAAAAAAAAAASGGSTTPKASPAMADVDTTTPGGRRDGKRRRVDVTSDEDQQAPTTPASSMRRSQSAGDLRSGGSKPATGGRTARARRAAAAARFASAGGEGPGADGKEGGKGEGLGKPDVASVPSARFTDVGGVEACLKDVTEQVLYPLRFAPLYRALGTEPPRGVLLHGAPGCGKTLLAHAIAGELGVPFHKVNGPELVSSMSGESEAKIRALFASAVSTAPSLVFIDEIDAIAPKRDDSSRGMEKRIVAQLSASLDSLSLENTGGSPVIVIGATSRPGSIDASLRRAGRFDREIALPIPDEPARARILRVLCDKLQKDDGLDYKALARATPGFVGADLAALTKEAAVVALNRVFRAILATPAFQTGEGGAGGGDSNGAAAKADASMADDDDDVAREYAEFKAVSDKLKSIGEFSQEQMASLKLTAADFAEAVGKVQPSATREGFGTVPGVTFADVGALGDVREELDMAIVHPIRHPERFRALGLKMPAGVLLYGPPGCGKTLLAKAIANASAANFISIKGPELLDKYVGESERAVRQVFEKARASSPCIVFFDELDALAPRRGSGGGGGGGVSERVVNQLLTELDGLDARKDVFVIAATNRPDIIDPAMLRPGRLDKLLYVPLPTLEGRVSILRTVARSTPLADDVDLDALGRLPELDRFSGADLAGLVREAATIALRESMREEAESTARGDAGAGFKAPTVSQAHFKAATRRVTASVSRKDQRVYNSMPQRLRMSRSHMEAKTSDDAGAAAPKSADAPAEAAPEVPPPAQ